MEAKAEAEARQQSAAGARKPAIKSRSNANTNTNSNTHSGSRTPTARSASQSKALPMATQRASFTGTARSSSSNSSKSSVSANTSKSSSSKSSISNSISRRASYSCNSSSTARVPPSTPSVTVTGAMPRARPATSNSSSNNSNIRKSTEARKSSASSSKSKSLVQSSAAANAASKSRAKQQSSAAASASETNSNGKESRLPALPQSEVKAADEVRLDLRGHKLRSLDSGALNLSPNLEFVYLRDNKLSSLIGIEILKKVKVLDLSFNEFKGTGFEPLENCKGLQQLYLAGNQITSLSGLPELPNLEFLSVAQNKLKSLVMASQPRLQVLAASKNKISTLKGFPYLPMLEHLRLEENPILEMPHLEAAAILLVGVTLKKFNDRDISADEKKLAKQYPAHTSLCIRDGWDFCGPEKASDSTMDFLLSKWKCNLPPGYLIKKAAVEQPFEEDACKCHFVFMKDRNIYEETELTLRYQWFISEKTPMSFEKIPGAVNDVYWPKREEIDKHLKVECTPVLREVEYSPIFAVSAPVAPGTGCPKVLSLRIEGDLIEGNLIKGFAEVAWCGGTPSKGVASWLRRKWNSSPVVISGAEDEEYRLTFDDVDCSLVFMYTPVTKEGRKGEPQYAMTEFVKAAFPSVSNVQVIGDPVEGKLLKGVGTYFGGEEGPSKFEWFREDRESGQLVPISSGASEYMLTEDDVGCSLRFVYTPVNLEGLEGNPSTVTTAIISRAPPRVNHLHIIGDLCEGSKVVISATVKCAIEGASRVQWFKTNSRDVEQGESGLEAISSSKVAKAFRIPLSAVGHYLVAKYTPVAQDGESGEPALVITDKRVESLPPSLSFLSISGDFKEGETLTASYGYFGGHEGNSEYNWYLHQDENDPGTLINEAVGHLQYQITNDAVYKFISFKCIPIRDDGVVGECRSTMSHERVQPAFPRILSLQIVGECVEGQKLSIEKKYWGGDEGASRIQWFLTHEDGMQTEIKGATSSSYVLCKYDIGGLVSVSYEPVRNDGTKGTIAYSSFSGPVLAGPPSCDSLELHGEAVEGGCLSFSAVYSGGEQGNCFHEWIQQGSNGRLEHLTNDDILELTHEDVGSRIELVFTPVRKDGCTGRSQKILSDIIGEAEPVGIDLVIPLCCEDQEVVPEKSYYGGTEGSGQYTWYRVYNDISDSQLSDLNDMKEMKILSNSRTYIPTLEDVGSYLALRWVPTRKDGKVGKPLVAKSRLPVSAAPPRVCNVHISEASSGVYVGKGEYYGGVEGNSQHNWYRSKENGTMILIHGANSNSYHVSDDDYACQISFGYLPVRSDGEVGELCLSEPSNVILPEMPQVQKIVLTGKAVEGEKLTAVEVILNSDLQKTVWDKYKKDVKYQWSRSPDAGPNELFEPLLSHCSCSYKVGLEDVGFWLQCECVLTDVFGRCSGPVSAKIGPVLPGIPKVEKLEIQGKGYHTNLYAVQGTYSGGKEGKSRIQWFRSMVGSPDLISIPGKVDATYEANVDDVGYQLVVRYTPARDDCLEGIPVFTSTEPICVEPDILKEVKQKLELGAVKFEVLRDRDHSPRKSQAQALGSLEKRILDVNRKRLKVIKPGSKTSFPNTEIRGTYAPPFHVELIPNDQHRLKIVIDSESEVDLMVHTRHMRDVIVLVLRGLAQRFNSTSLISLLKM